MHKLDSFNLLHKVVRLVPKASAISLNVYPASLISSYSSMLITTLGLPGNPDTVKIVGILTGRTVQLEVALHNLLRARTHR